MAEPVPPPGGEPSAIQQLRDEARSSFLRRDWARAAALFEELGDLRNLPAAQEEQMWAARAFAAAERGEAASAVDAYLAAARLRPERVGNDVQLIYDSLHRMDAPEAEVWRLLGGLVEIAPATRSLERLTRHHQRLARANGGTSFLSELDAHGMVVQPHAGANAAVFIFGGVRGHLRMPFLALELRDIPAHLIFLHDRRNLVFAKGIEPLGSTYAATLARLTAELDRLGAERVITLGFSAGGFPAVLYGLDLDASASLLFSTITSFAEADYNHDGRGLSVYRRIRAAAGEKMGDLLPLLERKRPPMQVVCVFGAGMRQDRAQAMRLRGVPGVALVAIPRSAEHDSASTALRSGLFQKLLAALVDGCGAAEARRRAMIAEPP